MQSLLDQQSPEVKEFLSFCRDLSNREGVHEDTLISDVSSFYQNLPVERITDRSQLLHLHEQLQEIIRAYTSLVLKIEDRLQQLQQ